MSVDERLIKALHVEAMRRSDVHAGHQRHVIFQISTIDALLDGAYDGDVSFAVLREHGDFGLGTLEACDGEMIALDGEFFQAAADGTVRRVADEERTPFALVLFFRPEAGFAIERPRSLQDLQAFVDARAPAGAACHALRLDGRFDRVRVRSVPRQHKPYPPLAEVARGQQVFDLEDVPGSIVGFRFPDYAQGIDVPGYHLHFITDARDAGGHVLDCVLAQGQLALDHSSELHLELPPGVDLRSLSGRADRLRLMDEIEHDPSG